MRRLYLLIYIIVICTNVRASGIKGELKTEKNGFQWYYHKTKTKVEAYNVNGELLFEGFKKIYDIQFLSADEKDEGIFVVTGITKKNRITNNYIYSRYGNYEGKALLGTSIVREKISFQNPNREDYFTLNGEFRDKENEIQGCGAFLCNRTWTTKSLFKIKNNLIIFYDGHIYKYDNGELNNIADRGEYVDSLHLIFDKWRKDGRELTRVLDSSGRKIIGYSDKLALGQGVIAFQEARLAYGDDIRHDRGAGIISIDGKMIMEPQRNVWLDTVQLPNGKKFFKFTNSKSHKEGLYDISGKNIIPMEMDVIRILEDTTNFFEVKKGSYYGIISDNGREIIPLERHYTLIYRNKDNRGGFCYVNIADYHGECDINGKELTRVKSTSLKASSSNSSSKRSRLSTDDGILYSGIYTISGQGRDNTTGQVTSDIGDMTNEIKIYEDCIAIDGVTYEFYKKQGSTRVYKGMGMDFGGMSSQDYYYVDANYNMKKVAEFSSAYGTNWVTYSMSKGETTMPKYSNASSGGNSGSSYGNSNGNRRTTTGSSNNRKACAQCKFTNGKCPVCKGMKKVQGSYGAKIDCTHCGGSGLCPKCNGTGFWN